MSNDLLMCVAMCISNDFLEDTLGDPSSMQVCHLLVVQGHRTQKTRLMMKQK